MNHLAESTDRTYNANASVYDEHWTRHVLGQHARMTRELKLHPGESLVDIAAGPGTTLEMLRLTTPGEAVAVDPSRAMIDRAIARAREENLALTGLCTTAQEFLATCEDERFDVLSLRFGLAYIEWEKDLPRLAKPVKRGTGRVGVLTNLATSAPQALTTYHAFMDEMGMEKAWPPVPQSAEQVATLLAQGGLDPISVWSERVRVWFDSGLEATDWLLQSGFIAGDALDAFPKELLDMMKPIFGAKLVEDFGVDGRVPFDFDIGCVIALRG